MKSTNGTKPTAPSPAKKPASHDVCAIIEACSKAGVSKLKYGDLVITFPSYYHGLAVQSHDLPKNNTYDGFAPHTSEQDLEISPMLGAVDKELVEEAHLAQLAVNDPLAFEEAMIDQELRGSPSRARPES